MKPISFEEQTKILTKPEGWTDEKCGSLPIYTNGEQCISCWELSDAEIQQIKITKKIWFAIYSGWTQPPILPSVNCPINRTIKVDACPVCSKEHVKVRISLENNKLGFCEHCGTKIFIKYT